MIAAIGDSYTQGAELDSADQAWPARLAEIVQQPVQNLGRNGTCNYRLLKRIIDQVLNKQVHTIVVGWTDPGRIELADDQNICTLWAGRQYDQITDVATHRQNLIKYITAFDNEPYYYRQWLRQVILAQSLCRLHNVTLIEFISCGADQRNTRYLESNQDLAQHIDTQNFFGWPNSSMQTLTYHLPKGPGGHCLAQGHELIANEIAKYIRN